MPSLPSPTATSIETNSWLAKVCLACSRSRRSASPKRSSMLFLVNFATRDIGSESA